ncbi:hypothetical protein I547_6749 [Mycobacterium kansasii 824]|uniref:Uncharacterized protein n=1 Tax=Mycobacterium kansasii TaxID=1768 RepID=A0A1V3WTQ6_MYCKA|nr:hypothetical protein I547_6749 [Mycobacterium kansasii 824]OOK70310.1 hypothetical protein BZL30_6575 [Mycobacterium kansasii]OOK75090.1 hypothetical protein BZL29_4561 [Mycobacterium kansasii]
MPCAQQDPQRHAHSSLRQTFVGIDQTGKNGQHHVQSVICCTLWGFETIRK